MCGINLSYFSFSNFKKSKNVLEKLNKVEKLLNQNKFESVIEELYNLKNNSIYIDLIFNENKLTKNKINNILNNINNRKVSNSLFIISPFGLYHSN